MPYAYVQQINHVFNTDHLKVYVTFRHQMRRSVIPQATPPVYDWYPPVAKWLLEADEVPVDILSSEWLDEFTLLLTSDEVLAEPTGVTLEYAGPDEKLCYNWGKQIEPWGPRESFAGYPTTPAPHNSTHENGGADEINIAGLSGLAADTQHSFVDRGDPAAADWTAGTLTADGTWRDLDLSAKVPTGAKAVLFRVNLRNTATNKLFQMRKNGNVNAINRAVAFVFIANLNYCADLTVALDADRKIEYYATATGWTVMDLIVAGWFF